MRPSHSHLPTVAGSDIQRCHTICLRFLVKRSQGRRKVPKNFRRRYFVLTAKALTYAKSRSDAPLCVIPASDLLAVERVDDQAFNMKFVSV